MNKNENKEQILQIEEHEYVEQEHKKTYLSKRCYIGVKRNNMIHWSVLTIIFVKSIDFSINVPNACVTLHMYVLRNQYYTSVSGNENTINVGKLLIIL